MKDLSALQYLFSKSGIAATLEVGAPATFEYLSSIRSSIAGSTPLSNEHFVDAQQYIAKI